MNIPTDQDYPPAYRRLLTATHEAGHAVVAYLLGAEVHEVTIIPDGDTLGSVWWDWWPSVSGPTTWPPSPERVRASRQELRDKMAIALAGRAAVELIADEIPADDCTGDDNNCAEYAELLHGMHPANAPRRAAEIADQWARVAGLTLRCRAAIVAVAAELLRADAFDGVRLYELIDEADPELLRPARAYLNAA